MKPCCKPIFILVAGLLRPTSVVEKPCQADTLRYNQMTVADIISVAKKIETNASIFILLNTGPLFGPVYDLG